MNKSDLQELFFTNDMDGVEAAVYMVDSGQLKCPKELDASEWDSLKTAAEGAADFIDLMEKIRDKYNIDYF